MKTVFMSIGTLTALLAGSYVSAQENRIAVESAPVLKALRLDYSTFLGGSDEDRVHGMAVDSQGNIYLTAPIRSADFPTTPNALQKEFTVGRNERQVVQDYFNQMNRILKEKTPKGFQFSLRRFDGEEHSTICIPTTYHGLKFVFAQPKTPGLKVESPAGAAAPQATK